MAYDAARGETILYGFITPGNVTYTQTWAWNGGWSMRTPANSPPGLKSTMLSYDEERKLLVLSGGAITPTNAAAGFRVLLLDRQAR